MNVGDILMWLVIAAGVALSVYVLVVLTVGTWAHMRAQMAVSLEDLLRPSEHELFRMVRNEGLEDGPPHRVWTIVTNQRVLMIYEARPRWAGQHDPPVVSVELTAIASPKVTPLGRWAFWIEAPPYSFREREEAERWANVVDAVRRGDYAEAREPAGPA